MKAEITKIKLKLKDREIELTAAEAREIHGELSELFKVAEKQKEYVPMPYPVYPTYPIIIEREDPYWRKPYVTWYGTNTKDLNTAGNFVDGTVCMNLSN